MVNFINGVAWRGCAIAFIASLASAAFNTAFASDLNQIGGYRSVKIGGEMQLIGSNETNPKVLFSDAVEGDIFEYAAPSLRTGMNLELCDGACFAQGVALQSLVATSREIRFEGLADVNVNGIPPYPLMLEGTGGAQVQFNYQFNVAQRQSVTLQMESQVDLDSPDGFVFSIKNEKADYIWSATSIIGEDGQPQRAFTTNILLEPGNYFINASLSAYSNVSGSVASSGRSHAVFAISTVPEPNGFALAIFGGLALVVCLKMNKVPMRPTQQAS